MAESVLQYGLLGAGTAALADAAGAPGTGTPNHYGNIMVACQPADSSMSVQKSIERKLAQGLGALHLEVINESGQHNVPAGSESHFKVIVVSKDFEQKTLVAQHRLVYKLLGSELKSQVHALALHTYTEQGWRDSQGAAPASPPCRGGKSREQA